MKKLLLRTALLLFIINQLSIINCHSQWVSIPDTIFGTWLNTHGYTACLQGNNGVGWQMDTSCPAVMTATGLNVDGVGIYDITGWQYFDELGIVNLQHNHLTFLPPTPRKLWWMYCGYNQLTTLPPMPSGMRTLICDHNPITSLPFLNDSLDGLGVYNDSLLVLPVPLPSQLRSLSCSYNGYTSLSALPPKLQYLQCDHNPLTTLPALPATLRQLQCMNTQLTTLPSLPALLQRLECNNSQLTALPSLPSSLEYLACSNNSLTTLPALPDTLGTIDCSNNQLTGLPALPTFLKYLYCNNNLITSIPAMHDSLQVLYCPNNNLTTLPLLSNSLQYLECSNNQVASFTAPLPDSLRYIMCNNNQLTSLPALNEKLRYLTCSRNQLSSFPAMNDSLEYLDCSYNQISIMPALGHELNELHCYHNALTGFSGWNDSITELYCFSNQLSSLPALPLSLNTLVCDSNQLTSLPALPDSLTYLSCSANQLSSLPTLPSSLWGLECGGNNLSALPVLPNGLASLGCGNNPLFTLPVLPPNLDWLDCPNNQLTTLPALPAYMYHLNCDSNQLTSLPVLTEFYWGEISCRGNNLSSLPELPEILYFLYCDNNPNLHCLPQLKYVEELSFTNCGVTCLPNYGDVYHSVPPLNSLPLCGTFNQNGCHAYWNISGKTYFDNNADCILDINDVRLRNIKLQLWSGGIISQEIYSGYEGLYSFDVDTFGNYEVRIDTATAPYQVICPAGSLYQDTIIVTDSLDYDRDFSFECKPGFDLTAWSIMGRRFRPASYGRVNIAAGDLSNFYGIHCASGIGGNVTVSITGPATYVSPDIGSLAPSSVSGNLITYSVADFSVVNLTSDFNIIFQTDTNAVIGAQVCFTVSVTPSTGDNNPINNTLTQCFTVSAAYDPNDKQVYPLSDVDVNGERWLTYTINFQNTGTDTAIHIYITDTLDADLDVSTFQLLAYSHQPLVQIKENAVRFNFPNIMLVDSHANEPLSHGYVQYKIKIKDSKPVGTVINNTAYIYFDFNAPVVTNTTTNTIALISGIAASREPLAVRIYPNPASNAVIISIDEGMIGSTATITDITGRKMTIVQLQTPNTKLETQNFTNGVYFVTVTDKEGRSATKKLVIQK